MSQNPLKRCKTLRMKLEFTHPVVFAAAPFVEAAAIEMLGSIVKETEYVQCTVSEAIVAVEKARDLVSRRMHADPAIDEDAARKQRVLAQCLT